MNATNSTNSTPTITTSQTYADMLARDALEHEPRFVVHNLVHASRGSYPTRTFIVEFIVEDTKTNDIKLITFDGRDWTGAMN